MQVENVVTDKCVLCKTDTNIPVDTHIHKRQYYVEGSGQLCKKCYIITFKRG